jgi:hypothetical protein
VGDGVSLDSIITRDRSLEAIPGDEDGHGYHSAGVHPTRNNCCGKDVCDCEPLPEDEDVNW